MWKFCSPITSEVLKKFETAFNFNINDPLRGFLLEHNGGKTRYCSIPTNIKERRVATLLDFSQGANAWEVNRRMRKILGNKCIVIGTDRSENFICLCRDQRHQSLAIWNHISGELEDCSSEIPVLLLLWQSQIT